MAYSAQTLDISGDRQSGQDVRTQNGTVIYPFLPLFTCITLPFLLSEVVIVCCILRFSVTACQAVANIVKSSLGPVGLDKVRFYFS